MLKKLRFPIAVCVMTFLVIAFISIMGAFPADKAGKAPPTTATPSTIKTVAQTPPAAPAKTVAAKGVAPAPVAPEAAKSAEPAAPINLESHLLEPNAEWQKYYANAPAGTVKLYYTLAVTLDALRQQAKTIIELQNDLKVLKAAMAAKPADAVDKQTGTIDGTPPKQ